MRRPPLDIRLPNRFDPSSWLLDSRNIAEVEVVVVW